MTRKSEREIERDIEQLVRAVGNPDTGSGRGSRHIDYPIVSLAELIVAAENETLEVVDHDRRLYHVGGRVKRVPQDILDVLAEVAGRGES